MQKTLEWQILFAIQNKHKSKYNISVGLEFELIANIYILKGISGQTIIAHQGTVYTIAKVNIDCF